MNFMLALGQSLAPRPLTLNAVTNHSKHNEFHVCTIAKLHGHTYGFGSSSASEARMVISAQDRIDRSINLGFLEPGKLEELAGLSILLTEASNGELLTSGGLRSHF